jgi:DNA-binding SARP family transcriptional activator/tetratricopeptide (TPR) repeat protein
VLGAAKLRAVLALLLLHANQLTSLDHLIDELWEEHPPSTAANLVQQYISRLRRMLRPGGDDCGSMVLLATRPGGYLLQVEREALDANRFQALVEQSRLAIASGDTQRAAHGLRQGLALWRGAALVDVPPTRSVAAEAARLEELRLAAVEDRIRTELALGQHTDLIGELQALVDAHPLRERLRGQLMLALYRSGRQAEALAVYRAGRRVLVEELGLEPGQELQALHQAILTRDCTLDPPGRAGGAQPAGRLVVPAQLPADPAEFTGRADVLRQLHALLQHDRGGRPATVVISAIGGTAGVGKTALAVHWAHRVRAGFPDGQLYVNLRGYAPTPPMCPVEALAQLLRALGVGTEQVPVEVEEAAGLYRSLLTDRRVLIVLDNARDAEQVRPLLPAGPGCLVLVTSRDRLSGLVARDGARRLTLDVLAPAEAHELLARILGQEQVQAEPEATAELARVCGFLPLALRIAAANLLDQPGQPIASYVTRLRAGDRLAELAVDGDPQAAVGMAFDASYAALDRAAQRLFGLLGLVPGPDVTAGAAATLAGATLRQAERLLERLAGAHLLEPRGGGRYGFHDLLRLYARRRAEEEDSEPARQAALGRLLGWYLHTADAAARLLYPEKLRLPLPSAFLQPPPTTVGFADDTQALVWLDAERANLVAAVQHAAEHGPRPAAWLLADALRGYFVLRMHMVDWLAVAHAGLAAAEVQADPLGQAAAQLSLADAYAHQSQYQRAVEHYSRALRLTRQTGWLAGQACALGNLSGVSWEQGRLQEAADHLVEALALARQTGRLAGQAASLGNLGVVYGELGRLAEAADHHRQAIALFRKTGSRGAEADELANLGETYHMLGRLDDALDHLTHALAVRREVGDRDGEADALRALAEVHREAGHHAHALELAHTAVALAGDTRHRRFEADALNSVASLHQRLGQHQQAIDHHQQALRLARETEAHYPEVVALLGLAAAHQHLQQPDQALGCAHQACTLARQTGYRLLEGQALTTLAGIHLDQRQPDRAIRHAREALAIQRATGHRLGQAHTLLVLGRVRYQTEGADAALPHWQEALELFADIGSPEANHVRALLHHLAGASPPGTRASQPRGG